MTAVSRPLAILALIASCLFFGVNFPLIKALLQAQAEASGHDLIWITTQNLAVRFALAAAFLAPLVLLLLRRWPQRRDWEQGGIIAAAAGSGLVLQLGALNFTGASTVGFLTQFYVVIVPLVTVVLARRLPPRALVGCILLVLAGVALLAGVSPGNLRLGTGEAMALAASCLFTVHILALEAPRYAGNSGLQVTWVMFAGIAVLTGVAAALSGPGLAAVPGLYGPSGILGLQFVLVVVSTILPFFLMNHFQKRVSAAEAGVIYCSEAVFAAVASLFLPALLAAPLGITYANELATPGMLVGGGLILAGCILVQFVPASGYNAQKRL